MKRIQTRAESLKEVRAGAWLPSNLVPDRLERGRCHNGGFRPERRQIRISASSRALTELVEISVEIRELLAQIRDALVEREAAEPAEVDTVVSPKLRVTPPG